MSALGRNIGNRPQIGAAVSFAAATLIAAALWPGALPANFAALFAAPVLLMTWSAGLGPGLFLAAASALSLIHPDGRGQPADIVSTFVLFSALLVCAIFAAIARHAYDRERQQPPRALP